MHNQFGNLSLTVTGVTGDISSQSDIQFSYLLPMEILNNPGYTEGSDWARPDTWGNHAYTTYIWLDHTANPQAIAAKASALWEETDPGYKKKKGLFNYSPWMTCILVPV